LLLLPASAALLSGAPKSAAATTATSSAPKVIPERNPSVVATRSAEGQGGFVSGLVSGAVSRASKEVLLHPIDTIRARLQTQKNISFANASLYEDLYAGLVPALVGGVPAGALFFGIKDFSKQRLRQLGLSKQQATILAVFFTNFPYWLVRTPSELLKTRAQVNGSSEIVSSEWYESYVSNILYSVPADEVKFLAYDAIGASLFGFNDGAKVEGLTAAATGAMASFVSQLTTTPLDVARTRIMAFERGQENNGLLSSSGSSNPLPVLVRIYEQEGVQGLFSGLSARSFRAIASGAIQFASYELTQNYLKS